MRFLSTFSVKRRLTLLQLDYYVITGDGTLPSILTAYASLVSPTPPPSSQSSFAASPTLPPLSQFGYLSSSLSLAADPKAQEAILTFLRASRAQGFPVDGLYLSSGWCQSPFLPLLPACRSRFPQTNSPATATTFPGTSPATPLPPRSATKSKRLSTSASSST